MGSHATAGKTDAGGFIDSIPALHVCQLEEAGVFAWKCTEQEQAEGTICADQTSALIRIQLIAQISQISSPALGYVSDQWGSRCLTYLLALCECIGLALVLVAIRGNIDRLLYTGFSKC